MKKITILTVLSTLLFYNNLFSQLPVGGQWGCPSIPINSPFDTTCFQRTGEIKLGQGYFDHYGTSDPVYLVIPQNRPEYAIAMAVAWNYYRNVLGRDGMSINQWFATAGQENGFASFTGAVLPNTIFDVEAGANVALPCDYARGCNSLALYDWHVTQNITDGPFHNTLAGYQTISPYVPARYPAPAATYHALYNTNMEMAAMNKTFYDLSIYRRAQLMNGVDLTPVEAASPDPYGVEAAQALAYNLGPNAGNAISVPGYVLPAGMTTNNNWAATAYSGGVSCYAERIAAITAVLDNNEAYATSHIAPGCVVGNVNNWDFYSFYDNQMSWATVSASVTRLLMMYPEITGAALTTYTNAVQAAFNKADADLNGTISFRYEMGGVIDAIVMNLPKDDPGFNAQYAINGTGCKLDCRAPYTTIKPQGPTTICNGQTVILKADVDSPTSTTTYQWTRNGATIVGATTDTYNATLAGTYSVVVCWSALLESNGNPATCCSESQCKVTVTVQGSCSSCAMGLVLTPTSNSCTGMTNGSILATASAATGPYRYIISGPSPSIAQTIVLSASATHTFTGLRDGKYTIEVQQQADPTCRTVQDIFITPVTAIKEALAVSQVPAACNTQLTATLINQLPNTCDIRVSYGAVGGFSWDRAFFMDLKANGATMLTMFESYPSAGYRDDPWNSYPFLYPQGGPSLPFGAPWIAQGAPNYKTVTVSDGDILNVTGTTIVPSGTAVPGHIDGAVLLEFATFTNTTTLVSTSNALFRYQGAAPVAGSRQMGNSFRVTCPVVSPPAYTYAWTPTTGLSNATIYNPTASISANTTYTVTATHPVNTNCQLTASINVLSNCIAAPIRLLDFTASAQNFTSHLNWITSDETNCSIYFIERSKDGITFETIGNTTCNNSSSINNYTFIDTNPHYGINYYRIKQIDFDGLHFYTDIKTVQFQNIAVQLQPNPFAGETTVSIEGTLNENVNLKITEISGKELISLVLNSEKTITLGKELSAGVYILQVNYLNNVQNFKLVKQ